MAAMNVATGTVHPKIIIRNGSATFIEFLTASAILTARRLGRGALAACRDLLAPLGR